MYQSAKQFANKAKNVVVGTGLAIAATASQAAIDVTAVTGKLTEGETAIGTIGGAVLVLAVLVAIYVWVRKPIK